MPEGDTVHRTARRLAPRPLRPRADPHRLPGAPARHHRPRRRAGSSRPSPAASTCSPGSTGAERWTLHTHLKMEGAWRTYTAGERWKRPAHQARVVLDHRRPHQAVGFSLGIVELIPTSDEERRGRPPRPRPARSRLGRGRGAAPAARGPRPAARRGAARPDLAGRHRQHVRGRAVLPRGAAPDTPVGQVADLPRLVRRATRCSTSTTERATQATTGDLREPLWVYRRDRSPCRRCGTTIEVAMLGPAGPGAGGVLVPALSAIACSTSTRTGPVLEPVQVTTGDTRTGREHYVFLRTGQTCRRCGTTISTALGGGG